MTAILFLLLVGQVSNRPEPPSLEPLYRQALAHREKAHGAKHPKTADSLVDLAEFLKRNGNREEAQNLLQRAAAIYKDPVKKSAVFESLADLVPDPTPLLRESLQIRETHRVAARLADLREAAGDLAEAEALYRRALALARAPAETASAANNLGLVIEARGRTAEAEPLFAQAASIYEKILGRNHPEFATVLVNLAGTLLASDRAQTAIGLYRNAWPVLHGTLGPQHPHTRAACAGLVAALEKTGESQEALEAQRRCR